MIASTYLVSTQNELPADLARDESTECASVVDARMTYVLRQLNTFMGIHTYHVLADPKFLAEDKVLIARSQDKKANAAFDAIAASFTEQDFQVYRVMCQDVYIPAADQPATTAAYTNSLILNDHVYVPIAGTGYEAYDEQALQVYRDALPQHKVVGIAGKPEFPWLGTDAMHWRTRAVPREVVNNWLASQDLRPVPAVRAAPHSSNENDSGDLRIRH